MIKNNFLLIFMMLSFLAKAQIPLAEVKVNPTYTAWEVLEKAKATLNSNYDVKTSHNYKLFSQTIKNKKDTLLLISQDVKYKITRLKLFTYKMSKVKPQIKDSLFFNKFENGFKWLQAVFYSHNLTTFLVNLYHPNIKDTSRFDLSLEKIEENYKVNFTSEREKGYWFIDAKNFYVKEIFQQNVKPYEYKNSQPDSKDARPYKSIEENVIDGNSKVHIFFITSPKSKILLQSFKKEYGSSNYSVKVFIDDKFKNEITFSYDSVFKMNLLDQK